MPGSEIESRESHKLEFRVRLPTWPRQSGSCNEQDADALLSGIALVVYLCSLMDRADGYEPSDGGSIPSRGTLMATTVACAATKIATWLSNMVQLAGQGPRRSRV